MMMSRLWKVTGLFEDEKVEMGIIASVWVGRKTIERFCSESGLEDFKSDPIVDGTHFELEGADEYDFEGNLFYLREWKEFPATFKSPTLMPEEGEI